MNLPAANAYLRTVNKHKPVLLKLAGSNEPIIQWTHGLFQVFADAMSGDQAAIDYLDRNVPKAAARPSKDLFLALCEMSLEAHIAHAAPEEPPTPVAESSVEIIPGVYA
jgi:hypothetical protein